MFTVAALYQFAPLSDCYRNLQAPLQQLCDTQGVKGTLDRKSVV